MKKISLILVLSLSSISLFAQHHYVTTKGTVTFFSDAPLEDIQADNVKTAGILDAVKNEIAVQMKITDFEFPNKLMQEHFNENYLKAKSIRPVCLRVKSKKRLML